MKTAENRMVEWQHLNEKTSCRRILVGTQLSTPAQMFRSSREPRATFTGCGAKPLSNCIGICCGAKHLL